MACRFELVLQGEDGPWLRAAGEEALAEIERLEERLSRFRSTSDVSRVNAHAAREPVRVGGEVFALLQRSMCLYEQTDGAFDLTVAPLMQAWGFYDDGGHMPDPEELAAAQQRTGMHLVELDGGRQTVRFVREGMEIDLGAIGKGYAIDEAVSILREAGVGSAFLHGGTSTMYGIGRPLDGDHWSVAIVDPEVPERVVAVVPIQDRSLAVSAVSGKAFEAGGTRYGHVLDPRLGRPIRGAVLAAVAGDSAAESDALSTALLVHGRPFSEADSSSRSGLGSNVDRGSDLGPKWPLRSLVMHRKESGQGLHVSHAGLAIDAVMEDVPIPGAPNTAMGEAVSEPESVSGPKDASVPEDVSVSEGAVSMAKALSRSGTTSMPEATSVPKPHRKTHSFTIYPG